MKRWHLTLGLTTTAVVAAIFAPRLSAVFLAPEVKQSPVEHRLPVQHVVRPRVTGPVVIDAGLDQSAVLRHQQSERFLTVDLHADRLTGEAARLPINIAVVLDVSGSMTENNNIEHARAAARALVRQLNPADTFTLVTFSDHARVVVSGEGPKEEASILRRIDQIFEDGGTNIYEGLQVAERELLKHLDNGEIGKIVLLSDGNANVGVVVPDQIARLAGHAAANHISVSTVGLGLEYNEDLLASIADMGGGNYGFSSAGEELLSLFSEDFSRSTQLVASNALVTIEVPRGVQLLEIYGWDGTRTARGMKVYVGDIIAGQPRRVVARIAVKSGEKQLEDVKILADYTVVSTQVSAHSSARVEVQVTSNPNDVAQSIRPQWSVSGHRAHGAHVLMQSTQAYERGDLAIAEQLLNEGIAELGTASRRQGGAGLASDVQIWEERRRILQENSPTSASGRRAIKMNKVIIRDATR